MAIWLSHKVRRTGEFFGTLYHPSKHIIPLIILILYSFLGGWIFVYLENPDYLSPVRPRPEHSSVLEFFGNNSDKLDNQDWKLLYTRLYNKLDEVLKSKNQTSNENRPETGKITNNVTFSKSTNITQLSQKPLAKEPLRYYEGNLALENFCNELYDLLEKYQPNLQLTTIEVKQVHNPWDIWNATLYAASLYTTIGYGNIFCKTVGGRVATMIYSMIGIPLVLTILNDLGELLFKGMKVLHVKVGRHIRRCPGASNFPRNFTDISVTSAIVLLTFWICASAGIFLIWEENWDYFTSFYFFFITLTTIGLGDITPDRPELTLAAFVLVLLGLSVVSMCINIIQTKVEHLFQSMVKNIDSEYQQKVLDPSKGHMDEEAFTGGMGVMNIYKEKPLTERILYKLMDKHKKHMLEQYWQKKASTKNESVQTVQKFFQSKELQVDIDGEEEQKKKNRKYIYNLYD